MHIGSSTNTNVTKNQLISSACAALLLSLPASSQAPIDLTTLHAYLFYSTTGQISKDILAEGGPSLGNVITGPLASTSTLVVVEVKVPPHETIPDKAQVHLIATESASKPFAPKDTKTRDRAIADKLATIGPMNDKGISYVGFWLDNTGCNSISLKASIPGTKAAPATGVLPFTCYE